ncbi:NAD-dependent epimerase/dehydratase family protein [Patescibacteria group bacterium]|nr:NAD-dependent epimerase/dehydratase family protein [Patescibacteria group bacterium]
MYKQLLERKNILVAGGAGFIGSHLCDELIKNANVICVDNFITGQEENIDLLLQSPHFEFIRHDISQPLDLEKFPELEVFKIKLQGLQEIYNLACPTSPKEYNKLPIETLLSNADGTKNTLELAVKYKAKYLLASSSAIYGDPEEGKPLEETYWGFIDPVGPRSCYNEGKRFAESLAVNYGRQHDLSIKIARIFNTYGPRMKVNDGRMIPDFIVHALRDESLTIYGHKEATSTFCYVSDMVEGLVKLMEFEGDGIFNLGSIDLNTFIEVAEKIVTLAESKSEIMVAEPLPYWGKQGIPSITKAKEYLGWFPLQPLDTGLKQTIDYFKVHKNTLRLSSN